jgi:hypothetical protein
VEVDFLEKKSKQLGLWTVPSWWKQNMPNWASEDNASCCM